MQLVYIFYDSAVGIEKTVVTESITLFDMFSISYSIVNKRILYY